MSVFDIARACRLALERGGTEGLVANVGSGSHVSVVEIAEKLSRVMGREDIAAEVTGRYRVGDIRHCIADVTHAREALGYEPQVCLEDGMAELATWLEGEVATDRVEHATAELAARGLAV